MQSAPGRNRRIIGRLPGLIGRELSSARCLPRTADDAKVASRQAPGQEEVVPKEPQGNLPDSRSEGDKAPRGSQSGFVPDAAPDSSTVPVRGRRTPSKRSKPSEPAASVQPEAPDNLLEVLEGASIDEERRPIMSLVIQKVQSAKSRLSEACASLLTGFKVSKNMSKYYRIDSSP